MFRTRGGASRGILPAAGIMQSRKNIGVYLGLSFEHGAATSSFGGNLGVRYQF